MRQQYYFFVTLGISGLALWGCQPTVQLQAPEKPIVVNMNIDLKVKVEREVQQVIKNNPGVF